MKVLLASWILSGTSDNEKRFIPWRGIMEYALKAAVESGAFPDWVRSNLHFVSGSSGLVCPEFDEVIILASRSLSLVEPYEESLARLNVDDMLAKQFAVRLGVSEKQLADWGMILRQKAAEVQNEIKRFREEHP